MKQDLISIQKSNGTCDFIEGGEGGEGGGGTEIPANLKTMS